MDKDSCTLQSILICLATKRCPEQKPVINRSTKDGFFVDHNNKLQYWYNDKNDSTGVVEQAMKG
jgi:hypothetical protein